MARALYFPPTNDGFEAPAGELPPLLVAVARRPDVGRVVGPVAGARVLHVARDRGRRRRLPRLDRLRAPVPRRAQRRVGDRRRRRLRRGRPVPRGPRLGGPRGGWRSRAAAPAASRPSPRSPPGPRSSRPGISHYGIADLEIIHLDGHKFESRYDEGLLAPWPEGRHVFRERSPIHAFDRDRRPDADHAGPRRQGRAAVAARRDGRGAARPRDPARRDHASRARATATAAPIRAAGSTPPSSRSSARSSGSRPRTPSSPSPSSISPRRRSDAQAASGGGRGSDLPAPIAAAIRSIAARSRRPSSTGRTVPSACP